jgi:Zn-dependent peptidase ImmA (M78 family)
LLNDLLDFAKANGISVKYGPLGRRRGEYRHDPRLIILNPRMSDTLQCSTLAHELGHWHYGDTWTDDPKVLAMRERRANRYAAELLIDPLEYAYAERVLGADKVTSLARELGVAIYVVEAYREILHDRRSAPPRRHLRAV